MKRLLAILLLLSAAGLAQTCDLGVVFSPVTSGDKSAVLEITTDAGNYTANLSGTGVTPPATIVPLAVALVSNTYNIQRGGSALLTWTASGQSDLSVSIDNGVGMVTPATGGSISVSPNHKTAYCATASSGSSKASACVTIAVHK